MNVKRYAYEDPRFLNKLIHYFSPEQCGLTATLRPDVEEFIAATKNFYYRWQGKPQDQYEQRALEAAKRRTIEIIKLCQEHNILPFWSLDFDYDFRQFDAPKIEYNGPNFGGLVYSEPKKSFVHPAHFAPGSKWYSIGFGSAKGKESIERVQQAAAGFIAQGYRVTYLHATLNPREVTTGCCEERGISESYDAWLDAQDGEIEINGNANIDFDSIKQVIPKSLPAPRLLGENLEKILTE